LGERIFIESNYSKGKNKTALVSVRFGNVLESTGSVIPYFIEKIKKGEDIPLTDKRMTRFIITPKRAVQLVFEALKSGVGGELFVPKLKSMRIVDLIEVLQKHYNGKSKVKDIGIRPGEKINEILLDEDECTRTYELNDNYVVLSQIDKYQRDVKYPYLKGKKPLELSSYCSKDFLAEKSELNKILANAGILE
jgi:UDP-N-acetylglucosamine 4,6-dehydratase